MVYETPSKKMSSEAYNTERQKLLNMQYEFSAITIKLQLKQFQYLIYDNLYVSQIP